ncbi:MULTISPECIES: hypothetical protein [Planktothricoides]|uniref:Uncharacterized protein n=1 Tax=Planktothricoides raciborskii FACHB-1370 TaxID=2949576 RepID=A0ABR8EIC3_9CYAN|nr:MULTISPECIES: hypothetical protein [Planktothricoides]MBD2546245.1 hypothetical protein [Planktothricoides raciborskii FACHB-1370]
MELQKETRFLKPNKRSHLSPDKETGFLWWILSLTVELQKETRFLKPSEISKKKKPGF